MPQTVRFRTNCLFGWDLGKKHLLIEHITIESHIHRLYFLLEQGGFSLLCWFIERVFQLAMDAS